MKSEKLRAMTQCAILIAMGTVLSMIPIFEMPLGGSVTLLSMLPICMIGLLHGERWGFGASFVYAVIQLMLSKCFAWGLSPTVLVVCIIEDYIAAFTLLGVTGFFCGRGRSGMLSGISLALILRMICHYISGVSIWAASAPEGWNVYLYSLAYNAFYMVPEMLFTLIGAVILSGIPQIRRMMKI